MPHPSDAHGKIVRKIYNESGNIPQQMDEEIILEFTDNTILKFYHDQDCCESVYLEDICGDLDDLIGNPILELVSVSSSKEPKDLKSKGGESEKWTFYKISTIKGSVTIRWYGTSNGYYSEEVSFVFDKLE